MTSVARFRCSHVLLAISFQFVVRSSVVFRSQSTPSLLERSTVLGTGNILRGGIGGNGLGYTGVFGKAAVTSNASEAKLKIQRLKIQNEGISASQADQCEVTRQYGPKPSLCPQGNDRFSMQDLRKSLPGFKSMFSFIKTTFAREAPCCMGINHQFAIFHSVREVKPMAIIESGVAAGHGTFLLRSVAGPNIPIFSLDPGDPGDPRGYLSKDVARQVGGVEGWKDSNPNTKYFTGINFKDLADIRWDIMIPDPSIRARTLVILDDHQSCLERFKVLKKWGFQHVFYEDNYPFQVSTSMDSWTCQDLPVSRTYKKPLFGDAYSPDTVCSSLPAGTQRILHKDRFGKKCKWLTRQEHDRNVEWMQEHVTSYFEFPALFSACAGNVSRPTVLGQDPAILKSYGFPEPQEELWKYGHLYPVLITLKP